MDTILVNVILTLILITLVLSERTQKDVTFDVNLKKNRYVKLYKYVHFKVGLQHRFNALDVEEHGEFCRRVV